MKISLWLTETSWNVFLECQHILSEVYPCQRDYQCPFDAKDCYPRKMFLHLAIYKKGTAAAFLPWQVHLGKILRDQGSRYPGSIRDYKIDMVITCLNIDAYDICVYDIYNRTCRMGSIIESTSLTWILWAISFGQSWSCCDNLFDWNITLRHSLI